MKKKPENIVIKFKLKLLKADVFALVVLIFTGFLGASFFQGQKIMKENYEAQVSREIQFASENPFLGLTLGGKGVYVYDLKLNKILYSKNSRISYPLASITKLLTATVALQNMKPDDIVTIDKDSISQEGSSGLLRDEKWKLGDLVKFMLVESSNDAAHAIAKTAGAKMDGDGNDIDRFVNRMNQEAMELGMKSGIFYNESGLDISTEKSGAYASAQDVAKLIAYFEENYPEYASATENESLTAVSENNISHTISNTNTSIPDLSGLLASKTGFTKLAGGNLAIVISPNVDSKIAVVVLGSTADGRFNDTIRLVASAVEYKDLASKSGINLLQ